jgi:hypothetical protein
MWVPGMVHTIPVIVLALLWTSQIDSRFFVDFRDVLLLSNPVGTKINDFYYDYTLFPAEVFKSLEQKLLKTCSLQNLKMDPCSREWSENCSLTTTSPWEQTMQLT